MAPPRPILTAFTPLPPERNGIADYAALLLPGLAAPYETQAACADWRADAPEGVGLLDPALAHRHLGPAPARVLHQLGNNPGHGFVLRALRHHPGVVTLHDPGLLHLHETAGEGVAAILAGMADAHPALAPFARQLRDQGLSTRANHALFDLAGEALARARAVIVHSRFAAARLRALHGAARTGHVAVIPHLLPPGAPPSSAAARAAARAALGIPEGRFLLVTAGFATRAKRLDWVIEAVEAALAAGADLAWIHAGAEQAEEFPLAARIAARPALAPHARVTGWLPEAALAAHIAAADALVALRFPSTGEASGAVARGLAAGVCCILSDTAAYAELPREAVLHIPLAGAAPALAAALGALAREPGLARRIGAAGRQHALRSMALPVVAEAYRAVIEESLARPPAVAEAPPGPPPLIALPAGAAPAEVAAALAGRSGACRLFLAAPDLGALAALTLEGEGQGEGLVARLLPPAAVLRRLRVQAPPAHPGLLLDLDLPWRC